MCQVKTVERNNSQHIEKARNEAIFDNKTSTYYERRWYNRMKEKG